MNAKALTTVCMILIVHQQRYQPSDSTDHCVYDWGLIVRGTNPVIVLTTVCMIGD